MGFKKIFLSALPLTFLQVSLLVADEAVDNTPAPATTFQGTRGMMHTVSAEPLGAGRLNFSLLGSWYHQKYEFSGVPAEGSNIMTGNFSFSFGMNSFIDIFARLPGYIVAIPNNDNKFGIGSFSGGIQGSLPLPAQSPLRLGGQFSLTGGTSRDQINNNPGDGYNYYETRTKFDFLGLIMESILVGSENQGVKFHFNQGVSKAINDERINFLLSMGIQSIVHPMVVLGAEVNSRTDMKHVKIKTDPIWLSLSFKLRTPYYFSTVFGSDIGLSQERNSLTEERALEPFRLYGGFVFSFDALERKRAEAAEKEKLAEREKAETEQKAVLAQKRADSLEQKAREDSLALVKEREAQRLLAESLARKAFEDSVALAQAKEQLELEKSKRSDAEKQLLATGLLLLDAVYFESGKTDISINSRPYLNIIGKMLIKYPKLQIEVAGHTDNIGGYQKNIDLSFARASSVKNFMIQVAPELSNRLSARGYGPDKPKDTNQNANGRKNNRRVELQVINKDALKEYN